RRIVPEMMEHHDDHREIKRIGAKREAATIAPHAFERALGTGDLEHGRLRIEGDDRIGLTEELRETAGPRSDVEDALPIPQATFAFGAVTATFAAVALSMWSPTART